MKPNRLIVPIEKFVQLFPWPSKGTLYEMHSNRKEKGLEKAFLSYGNRILIDVEKLWECLEKKKHIKKRKKE